MFRGSSMRKSTQTLASLVSGCLWGRSDGAVAALGAIPGVVERDCLERDCLEVATADDVDDRPIEVGHGRIVGMSENDGLRSEPLLGQVEQHGLGDEPGVAERAVPRGN